MAISLSSSSSSSVAVASLGPGFRFHPTDEELVQYYLRRKVCGTSFRYDAICVIDIYKAEPWDLPAKSRLKSRDLEWYFFSVLDKKYGNGSRTNRATERGYWKTTGKDRTVYHKSQGVGMKKTLVYHSGRAPQGKRTNWVMHEYRLVDEELKKAGIQDAFVLCRVFQKSGSGPKNGEQYGAPFIEEEWEDDTMEAVATPEAAEEVVVSDDAYLDGIDLEQILGESIPLESGIPPLNFNNGDNSSYAKDSLNSVSDAQTLLVGMGENHCGPERPGEQRILNLPMQNDLDVEPVKNDYIGEPSSLNNYVDMGYLLPEPFIDVTANPQFDDGAYLETNDLINPIGADTGEPSSTEQNLVEEDYLLDEPYVDASDNAQFVDGAFLETNDLTDHIEEDASGLKMLEEYLTFIDADNQNVNYVAFDSSKMMASENFIYEQPSLSLKDLNGGNKRVTTSNQQLMGHDNDVASSSKKEPAKPGPDFQHPFIKQASRMLGSISAPPAFASEFPTKNAALCLNSLSQFSGSVNLTAGMILIRNMNLSGSGMELSFGKHGDINITLSFGLSRGNGNSTSLESGVGILASKSGSAMTRGWFYFICFCILVLSVSFKMGTCIYAR